MYIRAYMYVQGFGYMHERKYASTYIAYTYHLRVYTVASSLHACVCSLYVVGRSDFGAWPRGTPISITLAHYCSRCGVLLAPAKATYRLTGFLFSAPATVRKLSNLSLGGNPPFFLSLPCLSFLCRNRGSRRRSRAKLRLLLRRDVAS